MGEGRGRGGGGRTTRGASPGPNTGSLGVRLGDGSVFFGQQERGTERPSEQESDRQNPSQQGVFSFQWGSPQVALVNL